MEPEKMKFTKTHEWVAVEGDKATVGITDHAQKEISDVVFVELPKVGSELKQKDSAMVIESVKAAFDIYAPLGGKVLKVNAAVVEQPELVNQSPFDRGWLFQLQCTDPKEADGLMSFAEYNEKKATFSH